MHLLYRILYIGMFLAYVPKLFYEWIVDRKTTNWFQSRFFPKPLSPSADGLPIFWIHAVSVGEVLAAEPLVRELLQKKKCRLVMSVVTMTGMDTIHKRLPEIENPLFLPFDFPWIIRHLFSKAFPRCLILSEGDIWPEFVLQAKQKGSEIVIINAKLSDRSFRRMIKIRVAGRWLFSPIDLICAQNDLYAKRFHKLISAHTTLLVTGNTKGDVRRSTLSDVSELKTKLHINKDLLITIASSHAPEEQKLLQALLPVLEKHPNVRVVIVPRHPHRFESVFEQLSKMKLGPLVRYSSLQKESTWRILLLDKMGLLERIYSLSTIAFICGSFVETVGGHNIIEAAQWGLPCIVGPCMHSQKSLMDTAEKMHAVLQISSYEQAGEVVQSLLSDTEKRKAQSDASLRLAEYVQGASKRCLDAIENHVTGSW